MGEARADAGKKLRYIQQQRLAEQNGYESAVRLFLRYVTLRQTYLADQWRHEEASLPAAERSTGDERDEEVAETAQTIAVAIPLLAAIAPTPEAREFNAEVLRVWQVWNRNWPQTGKKFVITDADMSAINKTREALLKQLQKLPEVAPAQEQAALDALPEEGSR